MLYIYIFTYIKNSHWNFCSHLQSTPNQPSKNAQLKYSSNDGPWRRRFSVLIWWVKNSTSQRWELMLLWLVNLPPRWLKAPRNSRPSYIRAYEKIVGFPFQPANSTLISRVFVGRYVIFGVLATCQLPRFTMWGSTSVPCRFGKPDLS